MSAASYPVRATTNIINLLGDELIGSDSLAIFELVKNAYDADATKVRISFNDLSSDNRNIVIEDDGNGMSLDIIKNIWLTIGTDYKKKVAKTSPKFKRTSLGNKGIGRLAVHRLAEDIVLESKMANEQSGVKLHINWQELIQSEEYIEDLSVNIEEVFNESITEEHGTRIVLSALKTKHWTRPIFRELIHKIQNIKNPFCEMDSFDIEVSCNEPEKEAWIEELNAPKQILERSLYTYNFSLTPNNAGDFVRFEWKYKFNPINLKSISDCTPYEQKGEGSFILKPDSFPDSPHDILKNEDILKIGTITGVFHVFNLNGEILDKAFGAGQRNAIKNYIGENCGIKIFRDNIRVYNYGEPNDDWLGLELAKVQKAGDHFSKKVTVGAVFLNLADSESGLMEKTNREGFTDNETYRVFVSILQEVFSKFERMASQDRDVVEAHISNLSPTRKIGFGDTIKSLGEKLVQKGLDIEFRPLLKRIERDYSDMRDVMLNSGMSGLNLGLVFHEIEREIRFINVSIFTPDFDISLLKVRFKALIQLMENFSPILKQSKRVKVSAKKITERARQIHQTRFNYHNIGFNAPVLSEDGDDFEIKGPGNLLLSSISNLIDNAIYWTRIRKESDPENSPVPAIYVNTDLDSFDGPAIIVADNGTGFSLDEEDLIKPYCGLRPGGMGLGLYLVSLVMESIGGKLLFPKSGECIAPNIYDGATVALVFPND